MTREEAEAALMAAVIEYPKAIAGMSRIYRPEQWEEAEAAVRAAYRQAVIAELEAAATNENHGCLCADAQFISDMPRLCGAHARIAELQEAP